MISLSVMSHASGVLTSSMTTVSWFRMNVMNFVLCVASDGVSCQLTVLLRREQLSVKAKTKLWLRS